MTRQGALGSHVLLGGALLAGTLATSIVWAIGSSDAAGPSIAAQADFARTGAFPAGFLFGVATSSHQVEGHQSQNDWAVFEARTGVADSGEAVGHRDLGVFAADVERARSLGVTAYRLSLEWSRIEPAPNVFAESEIEFYRQALDLLRERGLTPLVTLHHFTLPAWLLDPDAPSARAGWADPSSVEHFRTFAERMAEALGSRVDYWTTVNEPTVQLMAGYVAGYWSPGLSGRWDLYLSALNNIIDAHRAAYEALKARDVADADGDGVSALVGLVQNVKPLFPMVPGSGDDQDARDWDYVLHKQVLDALTPVFETGAFPVPPYAQPSRVSGLTCRDSDVDYTCDVAPPKAERYLDFIGVNYHNTSTSVTTTLAASNPPLGDTTSGGIRNSTLLSNGRLGRPAGDYPGETFARGPWEIYPEGLLLVLRDLSRRYRLPLVVTENGVSETSAKCLDCAASKRPAFIVSHLQMVLQAIGEGVPVLGYFHWSLVDNFEWREGYDTRAKFGLFYVRHNREEIPVLTAGQSPPVAARELDPLVPGYQERIETPGAVAYGQIAKSRAITPAILGRWGSFPQLVGDRGVASGARTIQSNVPFASPGDPRTEGTDVVSAQIPAGCRILDASVALTDAAGVPIPQDVNYRQGGRVADTRLPPARRVEIRAAFAGGNNSEVTLAWSRTGMDVSGLVYLPTLIYRVFYRLECSAVDDDTDGLVRACDNCPAVANASQTDTDDDGLGDACDEDDDNDRLTDQQEAQVGTDPLNPDTDADGITDGRDVEWVQAAVGTLPLSAFPSAAPAAVRGLLLVGLNTVEQRVMAGDIQGALGQILLLRRRVDGCGGSPDATDWIVDCPSQQRVRGALDLLTANLAS